MNEATRELAKELHEAQVFDLTVAIDALENIRPIVGVPIDGAIAQLLLALKHEVERHEREARLVSAP
jgi:hypothetical protein